MVVVLRFGKRSGTILVGGDGGIDCGSSAEHQPHFWNNFEAELRGAVDVVVVVVVVDIVSVREDVADG